MLIKSPLLTNHICSKYTLKIVFQSTLTPTNAGSEYKKKSFKNGWCVTFVRCLWKLWSHELTQVGQMSHIVWPRRFRLNKFVLILLMKVRTSLWYNICRHENLHSISTQGNATFYSLRSFLCNLCNNLLYWQGLENSK